MVDRTTSEPTGGLLRRMFDPRPPEAATDEGLRERKKRLLRQKISDTATAMFLERGFDEVRVGEIAAACDISEKTIFNYFPTKESLLFDREEDQARQLADVLRNRRDVSLIEAVVSMLEQDLRWFHQQAPDFNEATQLTAIRRFATLIEETPALSAALNAMTERLAQVAAEALAERAGIDPDEPEAQMAATIILGLWSVQFRAMIRYADGASTVGEVTEAVLGDVRRAASLADGGLSSFNLAMSPANAKAQLFEAAAEADKARRQVMSAVKQARVAWRQVIAEIQQHHASDEHHQHHRSRQEQRAMQNQLRAEIRQVQHELRRRQGEIHRDRRGLPADGAIGGRTA